MSSESIKKQIKNAKVASIPTPKIKTNAPKEYADRQHQYYSYANRMHTERMLKYSTDYVVAQMQGLNPENPFEYNTVHIRIANVIRASSAISFAFDNYKMIEIAEKQYSYVRKGAKVQTMGNTWLIINPDNMSGVQGKSVIQRCDAVWNHLDYYGNIVSEPICVDRLDMRGVDPDSQRAVMINTGYFQFKMQYNENTAQLGNNSRLLVGGNGFRIAGYADFHREYTDNDDSIQMLVFRAMFEEPNFAIDDLDNSVAGGKTFDWDIQLTGIPTLAVGATTQIIPTSTRTFEDKTSVVSSTKEHPIYYIWESSDESIATVDVNGDVTAVSEGDVDIICTLAQNTAQTAVFALNVAGSELDPHVSFTSTVPETLTVYKEIELNAVYYENGEPTAEQITYTFSGAREKSYTATQMGNKVIVKCWSGSVEPLTITASYGEYSTSASIYLEGI